MRGEVSVNHSDRRGLGLATFWQVIHCRLETWRASKWTSNSTPYLRRDSRHPYPWTPGTPRPAACSSTWCCDCRWSGRATDSWWFSAFAGLCSLAGSCWVLVAPEIWSSAAEVGWSLWHIVRLWSGGEREQVGDLHFKVVHDRRRSKTIEFRSIHSVNFTRTYWQLVRKFASDLCHLLFPGCWNETEREIGQITWLWTYLGCPVNPLIIASRSLIDAIDLNCGEECSLKFLPSDLRCLNGLEFSEERVPSLMIDILLVRWSELSTGKLSSREFGSRLRFGHTEVGGEHFEQVDCSKV